VVCIVEGDEVGEAASRFSAIGCEALVRDFQQRTNGLLGIRVEGGRRFRVERAQVLPDQLTVAEVQWLEEQPDSPLQAEHADLAALLSALAQHPLVEGLGMAGLPSGQLQLANQLAYLLPLEPGQKLQLLQLDDPELRLSQLQAMVEHLQGDAS
ncbi:LON peptidase substrate-binding domain-containing protein, partial [Ectopseudomonas oleovorans]|uniref:LON peptidase substrate-binding domain-containing protein n=1 Tax=Ectopseudomonas oleovorans TaxID=301 RepID=UPI00241CB37F